MKKLIPPQRLFAGIVIVVFLLILYFSVLFRLQIIEGAKYSEESANSIVSTEVVAATRGNLLDRYGRPLVSSRPCHNIVINTEELFEQEDYNADILRLIETVEEYGEDYNDDLPITMASPFEFTDMTAIQKTILDECLTVIVGNKYHFGSFASYVHNIKFNYYGWYEFGETYIAK